MCGILGTFHASKSNIRKRCETAIAFIQARGPDAVGIESLTANGAFIELCHTRLSIIDVSEHANQPMSDPDCDWVISYNGEIYNYVEIREELKQMGWLFTSAGDTEVLLKAWAQWGVDALHRLNGMFAFAAVQKKTGEMWLVRDRFGVKPLYWGMDSKGGVIFSSSVAAVAQDLGAEVNSDYCAFGLYYWAFESNSENTPFEGVHCLAAGTWLKANIHEGRVRTETGRWYNLKQQVTQAEKELLQLSDEDILDLCLETLKDSVALRLRSDVPVAVSLSGGVDSSAIAAIAASHSEQLVGFSFGTPSDKTSEAPLVEDFARKTGTSVRFVWPEMTTSSIDALLERTLTHQEAPFPSLSALAQNSVYRAARDEGFKVVLGGQGGDEIFAGYRKFGLIAARAAIARKDAVEAFRLLWSLSLMLIHEANDARTYLNALNRYNPKTETGFKVLDWAPQTANLWGHKGISLQDRQIADVLQWSVPPLLRYEDRNSMGNSVESRLPFMDYRLVHLALALPTRMKIANGFGKKALRDIVGGLVPDAIRLNRKKRGFDVTAPWIAQGLGQSLRDRIDGNRAKLSPYIKKVELNTIFSDEALTNSEKLLDEALMLAWLTEPIRRPQSNRGIST